MSNYPDNAIGSDFDVAIVGLSARFPGASHIDEFWHNLVNGIESITPLSDEQIVRSGVPLSSLRNPNYVKVAPVLEQPGHFDAAFFGFSPMEARTIDPQHRILLELAHEALENAGYDPNRYQGRIGVFTGAAMNTYFANAGLSSLFAQEYIPTLIASDKDFLSTRISYKLNLKGPSITVQTACSTSLVAIHLARQSLLSEESDMALAGAISVRVPHAGYLYDGGGVMSPDGHVRAFDAGANGTVFGSGGGIVVLKRLADALSDGDTIRAVIKGSAVNNDGSAKAGYTAPSVGSQADVVVEALANAGVDADSISYVEAHGSGTPVGDPIEIAALTRAFRTYTQRSGYCAVGAVKTNIGHLDAAAGIAGIIKTVLALEHRKLPPTLHFSRPNPEIDFDTTPFYVNTRLREWTSEGPLRAGVMSTAMGGTNAHIILEQAPQQATRQSVSQPRLLVVSAKTETALDGITHRLRDFMSAADSLNMDDVEHTLQVGRAGLPYRRYLVCNDRADAITALAPENLKRQIVSGHVDQSTRRPVVLLFPGVGDHYVGMGYGLYETSQVFRAEIDRCSLILEPYLGIDIRSVIYPSSGTWKGADKGKGVDFGRLIGRTSHSEDQDTRTLNQTLLAHPALFTIEYALCRLWQSFGVTADAIVGHSMGEYVAACVAGVLSLEDALRLIAIRARLVNQLPLAAMLAVTLPEDELRPLLAGGLSVALINGPNLCVVAGPIGVVAELERVLNARGVICRHVQNTHAFHSRMVDPIVTAFEEEVKKVQLREPTIPYISNVSGTWSTGAEAMDSAYWARHTNQTSRLSDGLSQMWRLKNPILLEVGPGRTLGVLAMQHPGRRDAKDPIAIPSLRHDYEHQPDTEFLLHSIGKLWLSGVEIDWDHVHSHARRVSLPTYPFERQQHWLDPVAVSDTTLHTQVSVHKIAEIGKWFYVPSWKRLPPKALDIPLGAHTRRQWLMLADQRGFCGRLTRRLKRAGQQVVTVNAASRFQQVDVDNFTIEPGNSEHYAALIQALRDDRKLPDRIVHAWSLTGNPSAKANDDFAQAQESGFYSVLFLAKALSACVGRKVDLFALSDNVQDVYGTEVLSPEKSTLLGPCLVISQEYPDIHTKSIDIDLPGDDDEVELLADRIISELLQPTADSVVAYRNAHRWIQTYEAVALDRPRDDQSVFREGGVYLITGGLGNVGIAISRYLAATYSANLVLVGRSRLPERDSWDSWRQNHEADDPVSRKIAAVESIEALGGTTLCLTASVADRDSMQSVIERTQQHFGTLHGVIHGAGITGDNGYREIRDSTHDNCDQHFQAKARGLSVLETVLGDKNVDFCLLLSSLTSILGGIGQAAYASSNIYMDSFARKHSRSSRVPWISVNWDVWRVEAPGGPDASGGGTLRDLGMSAEEAAQVMETALASWVTSQIVVSTGNLGDRINQWVKLESLNTDGRRPPRPGDSTGCQPSVLPIGDRPANETEQLIARIWQNALGIDEVGRNDNFAQLGGHSLSAIRIVAELRRTFQIDLPLKVVFDAPTIAQLSCLIQEWTIAAVESLTDDQVQRLLADG